MSQPFLTKGSALIVVAIIVLSPELPATLSEIVDNYFILYEYGFDSSSISAICDLIAAVCDLLLAFLFLKLVILTGNKRALVSWICISILVDLFRISIHIHQLIRYGKIDRHSAAIIWVIVISIVFRGCIYTIGGISLKHLSYDNTAIINGNIHNLQPIGNGFNSIWKYYKLFPEMAVKVLLVADTIVATNTLLIRAIPTFILGVQYQQSDTTLKVIEGSYLQVARIVVNMLGFYVTSLYMKRLQSWIFLNFILVAVNLLFYVCLFVPFLNSKVHDNYDYFYQLEQEKIPLHQILFTIDILFRFVLIHFCIKCKEKFYCDVESQVVTTNT